MSLKIILIAILCYYILKVSGNMVRVIREDSSSPGRIHPSQRDDHRRTRQETERWKEDIEDAKWEDV